MEQIRRNFYPRPPRGGRRTVEWAKNLGIYISIHALREEGDYIDMAFRKKAFAFLSTPSARRATTVSTNRNLSKRISIHALREEGDNLGKQVNCRHQDFYPRPPRGGRPEVKSL